MSAVVKLKPATHAKLQEIAKSQNRPMGDVVTELLDRYERDLFWKRYEEDYERLRADPVAWQDYQEELELLQGGSMDGLEDEPPYYTPEEEAEILEHARATYGRGLGRQL